MGVCCATLWAVSHCPCPSQVVLALAEGVGSARYGHVPSLITSVSWTDGKLARGMTMFLTHCDIYRKTELAAGRCQMVLMDSTVFARHGSSV